MSVMKKKWIEFCSDNHTKLQLVYANQNLDEMSVEIDTKFDLKIESESIIQSNSVTNAYRSLEDYFTNVENDNVWNDLPLFVSSFKYKTKRIIDEIHNRLLQYMAFYLRILNDDGVARKLITHRSYSNSGESSGEYKNYESETPQVNLTNFDEGIKYASNLEKNEDSRSSSKEGESDFELKSFNWDEALRNMKMVFYNDLVRYILTVPFLIYDYYSLNQYPALESMKGYYEYIHTLKDIYARR